MEPKKPKIRRRKTETIALGVAMSALILTSCSDDGVRRRCIDPRTGTVVQSYYCDDDETRRRYYTGSSWDSVSWYYGGSGYDVGDRVSKGSTTPPRGYSAPGHSSSMHLASASTSRGGFGSSASAHGSGGGA
ncbi:MAG: hypothetical protein ABFD97_08900 [Syntrophobacter sp.]